MKTSSFIAYLTLGDGGFDYSLQAALALVSSGIDVLEIGIPFSDPIADGPVIQAAMQRSLECGTTPKDLFPFLRALRKETDIPVVIFSYANPILALGESFLIKAKEAGANAILIIDMPYEHIPQSCLDPIFVVSPSTSDSRLKEIAKRGKGFIYYACQKGTTGMRHHLPEHVPSNIARIRQFTALPIALGFGISSKEMAKEALQYADAFVVGSYFVEAMGRKASIEELKKITTHIDPRCLCSC